VLPSFNKLRPTAFCSQVNQSDWTVTCRNGSQILFFSESLQEDPDFDRWKGLEVNGFVLEEANELLGEERTFAKAIERAGSWIVPNGPQPKPLILLTCNPSPGWLKDRFYDPWVAGTLEAPYYFLPALPKDNPHLPADYLASLDNLPEAQYRRFVQGQWEGLETTRLFNELREDTHFVETTHPGPRDGTERFVCADWGWTAPAPALWWETDSGIGSAPKSRIYREWVPTQMTPQAWAEEVLLRSIVPTYTGAIQYECTRLVIDSAIDAQGQDGSPSVLEQMMPTFLAAGWTVELAQKGPGSLKNSTMLLHTYFDAGKPGARYQPCLVIDRRCPVTWKELTTIKRGDKLLHRAEDEDVEAPHQVNHCTAALRYGAMSRPRLAPPSAAERAAADPIRPAYEQDPRSLLHHDQERATQLKVPLHRVADTLKPEQRRTPWGR